jgi:hypothetical protein
MYILAVRTLFGPGTPCRLARLEVMCTTYDGFRRDRFHERFGDSLHGRVTTEKGVFVARGNFGGPRMDASRSSARYTARLGMVYALLTCSVRLSRRLERSPGVLSGTIYACIKRLTREQIR